MDEKKKTNNRSKDKIEDRIFLGDRIYCPFFQLHVTTTMRFRSCVRCLPISFSHAYTSNMARKVRYSPRKSYFLSLSDNYMVLNEWKAGVLCIILCLDVCIFAYVCQMYDIQLVITLLFCANSHTY